MKRPATVWIAQALIAIFASIWLFSLAFNLLIVLPNGTDRSPLRVAAGSILLLAVILLFFVAFWGLAKRRMYGKWLGVLSLVLLWGTIVYTQVRPPTGPIKRFEYNSTTEVVSAFITSVLISVGFLFLIVRLAFNKRVATYFGRTA